MKQNTGSAQKNIVERAGAVGTWRLVNANSTIGFGVKNFWGLATVRGRFAQAEGAVEIGEDGAISATLDIDAGSVDTAQAKRDKHLASKDFFDVEHFPRMTVRIDRVAMENAGAGVASGFVTILGQTRPVEFPVTVSGASSGAAQVTASLSIDRSAFGMTWRPMKMASLTVAIDVDLRFVKSADS